MYWPSAVLLCVAYRWVWRWKEHGALQVVSIHQTTRCCKQAYHNMNTKTLVLCNTCAWLLMSMPWNWYSWFRHWNRWQRLNFQRVDTTLFTDRLPFGFFLKLGLCSRVSGCFRTKFLQEFFYSHDVRNLIFRTTDFDSLVTFKYVKCYSLNCGPGVSFQKGLRQVKKTICVCTHVYTYI
jgi:hypothetical protein